MVLRHNTPDHAGIGDKQDDLFYGFRKKTILVWAAGLLLFFSLMAMLLIILFIGVLRYVYNEAPDPIFSFRVNKQVEAGISSWVPAEVAGGQTIPVRLTKVLEASIPFKQDVDVWIDRDFTIPVDVTVSIPIDQEIFVETMLPLDTEIPLDGVRVQTSLWGMKMSLPLIGVFPVNLTVPFKGPVHVKTDADVHIQQEVTVHVNKMFTFPLDLEADVSLPIDDVFDVSIQDDVPVNARIDEMIPVDVQVDLELPKETLFTTD